jgi:galactokinase
MNTNKLLTEFKDLFKTDPLLIFSPGRINFIGEHTDYNMGFVMPAAIDKAIYIAISKSETGESKVKSLDMGEEISFSIHKIQKSEKGWANYILGVIQELLKDDHQIGEINAVFGGDIPIGSGLSSSAALECGFCFGFNELYKLGIDPVSIAKYGQAAENKFVGMNCGIMDQYASVMGKEDHAMLLDCRSLERKYFPIQSDNYTVVLCNTNVKHSLVDSEYNVRRQQCEEGVAILKKHFPDIESLRDLTFDQLEAHKSELSEVVYRRCKYVIEENDRVGAFCDSLVKADTEQLGKLLFAAHDGLQHEYEVSCTELDFMVDFAKGSDSVIGSRMMGGGFGGCTINLIKPGKEKEYVSALEVAYKNKFGKEMTPYFLKVSHGTALV